MENNEVLYEVSDHIATLTLNRPDKLNAWTGQMDAEYRACLAEAEKDDDVRVIIVTGAGRGFCAGADMGGLQATADAGGHKGDGGEKPVLAKPGQGDDVRDDYKRQYTFLPSLAKPVIGAINGACAGIGLCHTLFMDLRFAADNAKFTTAFAQRGLIAEHGLSWLLPRLIGMNNAMDLTLSARKFTAQEALEMGLVGKVFPAETFMEDVREYAAQLCTFSSPRSLGVMKRQLWDAQFEGMGEAVDKANHEMMLSLQTDHFKEGVAWFVEKRAPNWPPVSN